MLKEFEITYLDEHGSKRTQMVIAFDASQAVHAFLYAHPEVDEVGLKCKPLG